METRTVPTREKASGQWIATLREGLVAGALSGGIVAMWYLICDLVARRPFHTPALLGAIFFEGLHGSDITTISIASVMNFTALHFAAFIAFGLATALVIAAAEREPLLILGALMVYACYEVCFLAFVSALDASALGTIGWWKIAAANLITLFAVFGYFEVKHPRLIARLNERWATFDLEPATARSEFAPQIATAITTSSSRA